MTEKDLFDALVAARAAKEDAATALEVATTNNQDAESKLLEFLEAQGANATARYDDIGYAKVMKPRLFASCVVENKPKLFEHLKEAGRADIIKTDVNPQSLSSYITERMGNGESIPDFINYYLKPQIRIFK